MKSTINKRRVFSRSVWGSWNQGQTKVLAASPDGYRLDYSGAPSLRILPPQPYIVIRRLLVFDIALPRIHLSLLPHMRHIFPKLLVHPFVHNVYPSSLPQFVQHILLHLAPSQRHLKSRSPIHNLQQLGAHIRQHIFATSHRIAFASLVHVIWECTRTGMDGGIDDNYPLEVRED